MGFFVSGPHDVGGSFRAVQLEVFKESGKSGLKRRILGKGGPVMAFSKRA